MDYGYKIRNWERYQHYKDRNPPWVKLYYEILSSRAWVTVDDSARVLLIASILVASRHGGVVPGDCAYIRRVAYLNQDPDFQPLLDCGFIDASNVLALSASSSVSVSDSSSDSDSGNGEAGEPRRKRKKPSADYGEDFKRFWSLYPKKEGKGKAWGVWRSLGDLLPPVEALIAAVERYKSTPDWTKEKGRFIPHPANWLEDRRWEDEPKQVAYTPENPPPSMDTFKPRRELLRKQKAEHGDLPERYVTYVMSGIGEKNLPDWREEFE